MTLATPAPIAPAAYVTPDRLFDAPLSELLADLGVLLVVSTITDPGFYGAFVERRDGQRILSMPAGRSVLERDTAARMLLGEATGVQLPPIPEPLRMEISHT